MRLCGKLTSGAGATRWISPRYVSATVWLLRPLPAESFVGSMFNLMRSSGRMLQSEMGRNVAPVALSLIKREITNTHAARSLGGRPKPPYAGLDSPGEGYPVMKPPSATNSEPVLYELSSEARNAASFAISRGLPVRPIGA